MSDTYFISTAGNSHSGRRLSDAIWGHCVGDLLGLPVEFSERTHLRRNPVIGPRAFGTFHQPAGTWTDDTSLTLCLLDGLSQGLDYNTIMRNFSEWLNGGKFTPHGITFDIGRGTCEAIRRFEWGIDPLLCGGDAEQDNGNGALMRILPALFFLRSQFGVEFIKNVKAMSILHNICALTHRHPRSHVACGLYLAMANQLLEGRAPADAAMAGFAQAAQHYAGQAAFAPELRYFKRLRSEDFASLGEDQIRSSGYVVDTLEAAVWCLLNTTSYRDCILKAVNLGEDTDTVAAVAGGLAGLAYGKESIPEEWRGIAARSDLIDELCQKSPWLR